MATTAQDLATRNQNASFLRVLRWVLWQPVRLVLFGYRTVKPLFVTAKSAKEVHAEDQAHQSAVRRQLRGLPATQDSEKPIA